MMVSLLLVQKFTVIQKISRLFQRVPNIYVLEPTLGKKYTPVNPTLPYIKWVLQGIHYTDLLT